MSRVPSRDPAARERRAWVERVADRFIPRRLQPYREPVLYLVVGSWNTLFGYVAFVVLYHQVGGQVGDAVVIMASYALAILNAYVGYRYVAFRSYGSVLREFPRFSAVYLLTMIVNLVFFPMALRVLPISPYAVQALFTIGVVITSYLGHRHFSFRHPAAIDLTAVAGGGPGYGTTRAGLPEDPVPGGE